MAAAEVDGSSRGGWRCRWFNPASQPGQPQHTSISMETIGSSAPTQASTVAHSGVGTNAEASVNSFAHPREISGTSILTNIRNFCRETRQHDRRSTLYTVFLDHDRWHTRRAEGDLEAQQASRADVTPRDAAGASEPAPSPSLPASHLRMIKRDIKREREEDSSLFGPNLAHYFRSGSSSSGIIGGQPSVSQTVNAVVTTPAAIPETSSTIIGALPDTPVTPSIPSLQAGRLSCRGRLREGSLIELGTRCSIQTFEVESKRTEAQSSGPISASVDSFSKVAADSERLRSMTEAVAVAEGIDIEVLEAWMQKNLEGSRLLSGASEDPGILARTSHASSQCTVLQSLVNLKKNTVNLMTASTDLGVSATVDSQFDLQSQDDDAAAAHPLATSPSVVQTADLRPAKSLSTMPNYDRADETTVNTAATHNLHFEYDCTTSQASIQIFVRASRKHGTWNQWIQSQLDKNIDPSTVAGAGDSLYFSQCPPHALGWPVHSRVVPHGYGQAVRADFALKLSLYAPPFSSSKVDVQSGVQEAVTSAGIERANISRLPDADYVSVLAPIPTEESKEQRQAREKAERETLKVVVVIEALDASGQPLAVPNLQVTYLRLTSLPVRPQADNLESSEDSPGKDPAVQTAGPEDAAHVAASKPRSRPARVWAAHVEGQEAEIGAHRFQLQELYGLSSRPPAPRLEEPVSLSAGDARGGDEAWEDAGVTDSAAPTMALDPDAETGECLICLSSPTTTLLLPCTHGLCLECSIQLKDSVKSQREAEIARGKMPKKKWNCPMCRRQFTSMLHLVRGEAEVMH